MSDEDITAAIDHLIAYFQRGGGTGYFPGLHTHFFNAVLAEGRISDEQFSRLCAAYCSSVPLEISVPTRARSGAPFTFTADGTYWKLEGVTHIYALREVKLDGQPLPQSTPKSTRPWPQGGEHLRRRLPLEKPRTTHG